MHNTISSMKTVVNFAPSTIQSLIVQQSYSSSLKYEELLDIITLSNNAKFIRKEMIDSEKRYIDFLSQEYKPRQSYKADMVNQPYGMYYSIR